MARSSVKFIPNVKGIGELQRADFVQAELLRRADAVRSTADGLTEPGGHDVLNTSTARARVTIMTQTAAAAAGEAEGHTLTRAIMAAGD